MGERVFPAGCTCDCVYRIPSSSNPLAQYHASSAVVIAEFVCPLKLAPGETKDVQCKISACTRCLLGEYWNEGKWVGIREQKVAPTLVFGNAVIDISAEEDFFCREVMKRLIKAGWTYVRGTYRGDARIPVAPKAISPKRPPGAQESHDQIEQRRAALATHTNLPGVLQEIVHSRDEVGHDFGALLESKNRHIVAEKTVSALEAAGVTGAAFAAQYTAATTETRFKEMQSLRAYARVLVAAERAAREFDQRQLSARLEERCAVALEPYRSTIAMAFQRAKPKQKSVSTDKPAMAAASSERADDKRKEKASAANATSAPSTDKPATTATSSRRAGDKRKEKASAANATSAPKAKRAKKR